MLKVGVTGGIGSGKSLICSIFAALGVPVFKADDAARHMMQHDQEVMEAIITLFGAVAYVNGSLNKEFLSDAIFKSPELRVALDAIVHPATIAFSKRWMAANKAPYIVKESALFFESGSNVELDVVVGVYAPSNLRIQRTSSRSHLSYDRVASIMASQMNDEDKMKRCHYVIVNDDTTAVLPQVLELHSVFSHEL
jgi:dephospho-CoA kinase